MSTINVASINSGPIGGSRNALINGNPTINQRGYVSGTATSGANQYTLDRWRVVTSGQSITWTDSANVRTVTAPAGGVEQVIEGVNLGTGTYTLSWTGTATATVAGSAVANGTTVSLTGGVDTTVRFIGGTFSLAQLEPGTRATPFERRSYGQELALCQRYYYRVVSNVADNNYARLSIFGQCAGSTTALVGVLFPVSMRTKPTSLETTGTANNYSLFNSGGSGVVATALAFNAGSAHSGEVFVTVASGLVAGNATVLIANNNTTAYLGWSAEL